MGVSFSKYTIGIIIKTNVGNHSCLWFKVEGSGFQLQGLGSRFGDLGFGFVVRVLGLSGLGCRVPIVVGVWSSRLGLAVLGMAGPGARSWGRRGKNTQTL